MKRILPILIIAAITITSCTKNITGINVDPTQFTRVLPEGLMNSVFRTTPAMLSPSPVNKYWEYANWISPPGRYDAGDAMWQTAYVNVLQNLAQVINQYGNDTGFVNRIQIARIYRAYIHSILAGSYGPVPITQANNLTYLNTVMFDSEDSAYLNILATLKDAASKINVARTNDKLTYDAIYGGDLLKWKKFANTLRLKIALRCTRNQGAAATAVITEVMADEANLIGSEAEAAKVQFDNTANGNQNPFYVTYSGIVAPFTLSFPKLNDFMLAFLRSYKDPRLDVYFDSVKVVANRYVLTDTLTSLADDSLRVVTYPVPHWGMPKSPTKLAGWQPDLAGLPDPIGNINTYSNVAAVVWNNPLRPFVLLGYAETLLMKAEAAQLGLGGSKTADAYYYAGIDANFAFWSAGSTPANPSASLAAAAAYKLVNGVKWGSSGKGLRNYNGITNANIPDGDINKIYVQEWMNYYPDQGFDAWCLQRRTWVLAFPPHTNPASSGFLFSDVPYRTNYPGNLNSLNPVGYADALSKLNLVVGSEGINNYTALKFMAPHTVLNWDAVPAQYDYSEIQKWYGATIESLKAAAAASGFTYQVTQTYKP